MVDLRVDVVRAARNDRDIQPVGVRIGDGLLALEPHLGVVVVQRLIGGLGRGRDLLLFQLRVFAAEILGRLLDKPLVVGQLKIRHHKVEVRQRRHIGVQQLGVIRHDRAVIAVGRTAFVQIVGHAGIEDRVHALVEQVLDVAVHELCRIAHGIRRDGMLALHVHIAGGHVREHGLKAERAQEGGPERGQLVEVQAKGQAERCNRVWVARGRAVALELFQLPLVQVGQVGLFGAAERALAAVARDIAAAAAEIVDGQAAMVFAQAAARGFDRVQEGREHVRSDQGGLRGAVVLGVQRSAVGAHQARDGRAGHIAADLLLERAQDCVV